MSSNPKQKLLSSSLNQSALSSSSYEPMAPPPAAPPPLPPGANSNSSNSNTTTNNNNDDRISRLPSYQRSTSSSSQYQSQTITVTNYYDGSTATNNSNRHTTSATSSFRGDATLRPNIGETNSAQGEALAEHVWKLQWLILLVSIAALLLQLLALLGNVLELHLDKMVLGGYLLVFSTVLILYEVHTPVLAQMLQQQVGILTRPLGRVLYLILVGGLCFGQGWIPLYVVGGLYLYCALEILYCYCKFPQYRVDPDDHSDNAFSETDLWLAAKKRAGMHLWATPEQHVGLLSTGLNAAASVANASSANSDNVTSA